MSVSREPRPAWRGSQRWGGTPSPRRGSHTQPGQVMLSRHARAAESVPPMAPFSGTWWEMCFKTEFSGIQETRFHIGRLQREVHVGEAGWSCAEGTLQERDKTQKKRLFEHVWRSYRLAFDKILVV